MRTRTRDGGREKAPPAICRKPAEAKLFGRHEIDIWVDGEQMRSFTYMTTATTYRWVFDQVAALSRR